MSTSSSDPLRLSPPAWPRRAVRDAGLVVLAAVTVTVISLAVTTAIAFDPEGWIVWARELAGPGWLSTQGGPAWKPLPVLLIAPFTWISRGQADVVFWLMLARAGSVLAACGVAAVAYRLAGWLAATLAALLIVVSPWWFFNGMLGNAEPLLVALIAGAYLAHDSGRTAVASVLAVAACLVRPEIWPFALLFGLAMCRQQRRRSGWLLAAILLVLAAWLIPELLHSGGGALGAARGKATASSARYASIPFLAVYKDTFTQLTPAAGALAVIAVAGAAIGVARAARIGGTRGVIAAAGQERLLAGAALSYVTIVAVMSEIGFAGNPRYLIPALATLIVLAAITGSRMIDALSVRAQLGARCAALLALAAIVLVAGAALASQAGTLHAQVRDISAHAKVARTIRRQFAALHCPRLVWTFAANRSTLAQIADQNVGQSAHPPKLHPRAGDFVTCAPTGWAGKPDR